MKILYIENEPGVAEIGLGILKDHNVKWVASRNITDLSNFDVVISNFVTLDGEFATTKILCGKQNVPLLVVSGHPNARLAVPVGHFVEKPFTENELLDCVERFIEREVNSA